MTFFKTLIFSGNLINVSGSCDNCVPAAGLHKCGSRPNCEVNIRELHFYASVVVFSAWLPPRRRTNQREASCQAEVPTEILR